MKKFIALALALVMMTVLAVPAFAAEPQTGTTTISYNVGETYTLTVTESLTVSKDGGEKITVAISDVNVATGNKVQVTISDGNFTLGGSAYKLGDITAKGATVIESNTNQSQDLAFAWVSGAPTQASTSPYTDTLTFTAQIVATN